MNRATTAAEEEVEVEEEVVEGWASLESSRATLAWMQVKASRSSLAHAFPLRPADEKEEEEWGQGGPYSPPSPPSPPLFPSS